MERDISQQQLNKVTLMQKLVEFKNSTKKVQKTLILYDVYKKKEDVSLNHLHAFAPKILDESMNIQAQPKGKNKVLYSIDPNGEEEMINIRRLGYDGSEKGQYSFNDYIGIYQKENMRVVALPIPTELINSKNSQNFFKELQQQKKKFMEKAKQQGKSAAANKLWNVEQQQRINKHAQGQYPRFLQIVQIDIIISIFISKCQQITTAGLIDWTKKRYQTIDLYQQQFKRIFQAQATTSPQFIIHSHQACDGSDEDEKQNQKNFLNSNLITGIFTLSEGNKVETQKKDYWNQNKLYLSVKLNTKIFQTVKLNNQSMNRNASLFSQDWRLMAQMAAGCIVATINEINNALDTGTNQKSVYSSQTNFSSLQKKFSLKEISIKTEIPLTEYFSSQKCQKMNLDQKVVIPEEIKYLVLAHEFQQIVNPFLEKYNELEQTNRNNQIVLLTHWKQLLKQADQLIISVYGPKYREQIQRHFDFLCLLITGNKLLKQSAGIDASLYSTFKVIFQQVNIKKGKNSSQVLRHIIADTSPLPNNMPLTYYNLYLAMIVQNKKYDVQKETRYRECQLRQARAYQIACNYIYDENKIVEAIKDYAYILVEASTFSEQNKKLISLQDIQKKIAKLLMIIGMESTAAQIYLQNRNVGLAFKTLSFIKIKKQGDERAKLLIQWGKKLERQLQYQLALSCYRQAYDCANLVDLSKQSIQCKLDCRKRMRNGDAEDVMREFSKFVNPQTSNLNQFTSLKAQLSLLQELKQNLQWDKKAEMAVIRKKQKDQKAAKQNGSGANNLKVES